jgi:hypothetical protein
MRIHYWLTALILPILFLTSCSKQQQKLVKEEVYQEDLADALVWKVEHDSLPYDNYLFGTIHLIDEEDYFLPNGLLTAIDQTDQIVFEIDIRVMNDMSEIMGMMNKLLMDGDTTLKDLLTTEEYVIVHEYFQQKGMPLVFLERIKPLFLSAFTSLDEMPQSVDDKSFAPQGMKSYEMELLDLAEATEDKAIGGLETIDFQLSLFDEIPYKLQAKYLVEQIKEIEAGGESDEVFDLYLSQDIEAMAASMQTEAGDNNFEEILLTKRNESWIPLMIEKMNEEPTLFAVGAAHLGGEKGVIRLLMKKGYTLTPVSTN